MQSGKNIWWSALGFLITAVGLPVITVVALARVGGDIESLSAPIGRKAGIIFTTLCYLFLGPLFALPRTATVSFEVGIAPLTGRGTATLLIYSLIYFALVILIALYPGRLLDNVGHVLAPLKMLTLGVLGVSDFLWDSSDFIVHPTEIYQKIPFSTGFVNGYLTMDTIAALAFGLLMLFVPVVTSSPLLTRYTIYAGLISGIVLILIYISLFKIGYQSAVLTADAQNTENGAILL